MANPLASLNSWLRNFGNSDASEITRTDTSNAIGGLERDIALSTDGFDKGLSGPPGPTSENDAQISVAENTAQAQQSSTSEPYIGAEGSLPPADTDFRISSSGDGLVNAIDAYGDPVEIHDGRLLDGRSGPAKIYDGFANGIRMADTAVDNTFRPIGSDAGAHMLTSVDHQPATALQAAQPAAASLADVSENSVDGNVQAAGANPLDGVGSWLYHLGDVGAAEAVKIGANSAGLVVIDYEVGGRAHTPGELNVMRGVQDKLIVSYLSIGEAEDYCFYWQSNWDNNPPDFLSGANPEWPDNYKVKYWDPAWQAIMFNYVDKIIAAGFNGIYMDIVDAYQYWEDINPVPGMNYGQEMADFVAAIRAHAEAKLAALHDTRDFVIMGQNGEELLANATYRNALDGVGKEDLRFYYENGHEGDFEPTPNGWYEGSKPFLELAETNDVQVFVVEYMTQARQTQYSSTLQSEIQYLRSHGIPLYISEDRDLTEIWPQPGGIGPILGTNLAEVLQGTNLADIVQALGGNDTVRGFGGNDLLNGGVGVDTMYGGPGNDTYVVDNAADKAIEAAGQGADTVQSSVSFMLGVNLENLTLTGAAAINGVGNTLNNIIRGNNAANTLNGGGGADQMHGFGGNDRYVVDHPGDRVFEAANQGSDMVLTSVSYALAAGQSIELLATTNAAGAGTMSLTGNQLAQRIVGNAGDNVINGGGGADQMYGLGGDDRYVVDNAGDRVFEAANHGADTVLSSVSYGLAAGQSIELLATANAAGVGSINLFGNEFGQRIVGNAGDNVINGGGGADQMYGLGGNDRYMIDSAGDRVFEAANQGADTVFSAVSYGLATGQSIEVLATTSLTGTGAINLVGNDFSQTINGNNGANSLRGGGGNDHVNGLGGNDNVNGELGADILSGGAGNDRFIFNTALNAAANVDTITDFSAPADTIWVDNAVFTALSTTGGLAASEFWASTTGLAHDANDRIVYDSDGGSLYYDPDGTGAAVRVLFAVLTGHPSLTSGYFLVI
jgi:uncharacterized protein (TIGR01370 family)